MNGIDHIHQAFQHAMDSGRAALMPYFTLGYPSPAQSLEVVKALAASGADLIELGIPFSDPLADGPTIQRSSQLALQQGMTVERCLTMVHALRQSGIQQPLLIMSYINPLLSYGMDDFIRNSRSAQVDGLILPDLPVEEASSIEENCRRAGLALVYMVAPTSSPERIRLLAGHSSGFLYLVSVSGITGARQSLPEDLGNFIARVRQQTSLPLTVGFGISSPLQAGSVGQLADGVIIGSALIEAVSLSTDPIQAVGDFMRTILHEMNSSREKRRLSNHG